MKIIKNGNPKPQSPKIVWWINKEIRCKRCGCIFILEETKDLPIGFIDNEIRYKCPSCRGTLLIINPEFDIKSFERWLKNPFKGFTKKP